MVTKEVSKQSWIALLEHDQLQIGLSINKQRNIISIFRLSSQLFFEQRRPNIFKNLMLMTKTLKKVARQRERSSFQPF